MHRARQILAAVVLLGAVLALVACNSSGTSEGSTSSGKAITLENLQFNPSTLTVQSGVTVTIENKDFWGESTILKVPHQIVIGTDDLGEQASGTSKTWTAPSDGVYVMKCLIHPSMSGQITVGAGGRLR